MAQEIMVAGAIYEDVPSVRLPDSNGVFHPFTDTSDTTAVAADVAQGKTFHLADGSAATGTASGATLVTKSITANGTYSAEDDDADGYSEVTVNVSGGGGGGGGVDPKDVNFIDYDGTVLHAYTAAEFAALTALPENPTHDGLVAQGWNWTLADAQEHVASYGTLTIGQMYITASGDTEIDIELPEGRLSPYLGLSPNGTVTIDWGDGSATDTVTGTSLTRQIRTLHNYAAAGSYTISVHVESGSMHLSSDTIATLLGKNSTVGYESYVYSYSVTAVRIGENAFLGAYAVSACSRLQYVTLPDVSGSILSNAFERCYSLSSITIPKDVTISSSASYLARECTTLSHVSIRHMTAIPQYAFYSCPLLRDIAIPDAVSSIGNYAFQSCYSLTRVVIPSEVASIGNYAFSYNYGLKELHFKRSSPANLSNANAFSLLPSDCTIYVPTGSLSAYTGATKYPSSSTYTYVEE